MSLELSDVQGLVFHAYRRHPHARYLLMQFGASVAANRRWLRDLIESGAIDSATPKDAGPKAHAGVRLNVAFTSSGLRALGLDDDAIGTFPAPFVEGLGVPWSSPETPDHRSRILGDIGSSAPAGWDWGYQDQRRRVDVLLLAFGPTPAAVDKAAEAWKRQALDSLAAVRTHLLIGEFPRDISEPVREAFGFVDGISQPVLKGAQEQLRLGERRSQPAAHELDDGEILLGHRDGARQFAFSPSVADRSNGGSALERMLPEAREPGSDEPRGGGTVASNGPPRRDLGRNGTYLVFRQLSQNVPAFERECRARSRKLGISVHRLKALMVGRWPNGSPLIKCPISPDHFAAAPPAANDFEYRGDPYGDRCPIGAHIRRANPRDALVDDPDESRRITNRHRILRRGRPYRKGDEQGLHFICLNADIARQFEFIQQNWINDTTFGGLHDEVDQLLGVDARRVPSASLMLPSSTSQDVSQRVPTLAHFVTVKGGGYFFLPGLVALRYLARMNALPATQSRWEPSRPHTSKADVIRFLSLTRFSLLLAAILALSPLALRSTSPTIIGIVRPMFEMNAYWELSVVAMLASFAAVVALVTWRIVQLYAHARFGVRTGWSHALTWGRVFRWQATSIVGVGFSIWYSAAANSNSERPRLMLLLSWGFAAAVGYATAFVLMYLAEALRQTGVRTDNAEDSVILPASKRLARWKRRKGVAGSSKLQPIIQFIERRTVLWPPHRGRGYINHDNGQIVAGHLTALALLVLSAALYGVGYMLFHPNWFQRTIQLPPAAYFLFLLYNATWALTAAAFFLDRYRVPLLTLLVGWTLIASNLQDADSRFPVIDADRAGMWRPGPTVRTAVLAADNLVPAAGGAAQPPMVVVAAGGGGAYQAVWTARVLTGLNDVFGARFSGNLRLVSGVSAGAVASMHFIHQYRADALPSDTGRVIEGAASGATGHAWWGLTYYDLPRMLLPFKIERDRGWALEQAWTKAMGLTSDQSPPTMMQWQAGVARGFGPAIAFNALAVESGDRVVFATYALPRSARARSLGEVTNEHDIAVVTAARLAAAFPYVTPFARAAADGSASFHIADGGYWDNHAVVSALEWLREAEPLLDGRDVVLIRIPPPAVKPASAGNRTWVWQLPAPLLALESVRTNAQKARNDRDIEEFARTFLDRQHVRPEGQRGRFVHVEFNSGGGESLSWHISAEERCRIERVWNDYLTDPKSDSELAKLVPVVGTAIEPVANQLPGCQP